MRRYLLLLLVFVVAAWVFWFVLPGDDPDRDLLERLAKHDSGTAIEAPVDVPSDRNTITLSKDVQAHHDDLKGHWRIGRVGFSDQVVLPYSPTNDPQSAQDTEVKTSVHPSESDFVGPQTCKECHSKNYEGFAKTSHAMTSRPVSHESMSLAANVQEKLGALSDPALELVMRRLGDRYVQSIGLAGWRHDVPMDVVTGSGKTGQSFLYWRGQALFQSHASLLTAAAKWIHSPGYQDGLIDYSRRIRSACLECHVTYIETAGDPRRFHEGTAVWGVTCERCHGPGKQHVNFYREHPELSTVPNEPAVSIVNPAQLSREQQLDLCGQCHSGMFQLKQPAFTYRPGDKLADFHQSFAKSSSGAGGIHTSDQRLRLEKSECFKHSAMTCTTCHNPHSFERGDNALFARVCQECHLPENCGKLKELNLDSSDDCIHCHMPISDNLDMVDVIEEEFAVKMVDHFIQINPAATSRFLGQ